MPTVEVFDGIKIEMYGNDHNPPHVHISYAEYRCLLGIQTRIVYAGRLPVKELRKAKLFVETHEESLIMLWNQLNVL